MSPTLHRHTPTLSVVDPRGLAVRAVEWHRTEAATLPTARITRHRYDAAGRSVAHQDPRFFARGEAGPINLSSVFSLSGQVLASDNVDAGWRIGLLADDGLPEESWDSRATHGQVEYDRLRRPVAIFEQDACVERFSYGAADADAGCNLRNRCMRHDDPAGSRYFPGYDLNGLLQEERQHFLSELNIPDWPEAIPSRDALLEAAEGLTTRWRYLASGELAEQTDARGNRLQQHYSVAGRLARSALQPAGWPTAQVLVSEIRYNPFAQVERQLAGNGVVTLTEYDPASGYLQRLLCRRGESGTTLQDLHYAYDPVGNVVGHEDQSIDTRYHANRRIEPVNTYEYDTLYQLISATGRECIGAGRGPDLPEPVGHGPVDPTLIGAYTRRYDYDAAGNLLLMQHSGQNNQQHALRMAVSELSNKALVWREGLDTAQIENAFDTNGNLLELQAGQALEWDARNQLQRVAQVRRAEGDDSEGYVYGGGGQRLRKYATQQARNISHSSETRYLPGIELHSDSATDKRWEVINIEAGRSRIRLLHWHDTPPDGLLNDQLYYGFDNHLGSSTLETDELGQLCNREEYYPFGGTALLAARSALEVSFKTIRYSGKERDATGLYYYGFRYLAPWLHRWINPDPAGAIDGLNLFGFVGNNPVTVVDRDGLMMQPEEEVTVEDASAIWQFLNSQAPNTVVRVPDEPQDPSTVNTSAFEELMRPSRAPSTVLSVESFSTDLFSPQHVEDPEEPNYVATAGPSRAMLPPAPRGFVCTYVGCQKIFSDKRNFYRHTRLHTGVKPYACSSPGCMKSFAREGGLDIHMRTHTAEKPFVCTNSGCGKSFSTGGNLTAHLRTHTGEKPFVCTISGCGKSFSHQKSRDRHQITHTGEKTHQCPDCEQSFAQSSNLKAHSTVHSGSSRPGPYMCETQGCYKVYSDLRNLRSHSRKAHSQK